MVPSASLNRRMKMVSAPATSTAKATNDAITTQSVRIRYTKNPTNTTASTTIAATSGAGFAPVSSLRWRRWPKWMTMSSARYANAPSAAMRDKSNATVNTIATAVVTRRDGFPNGRRRPAVTLSSTAGISSMSLSILSIRDVEYIDAITLVTVAITARPATTLNPTDPKTGWAAWASAKSRASAISPRLRFPRTANATAM